MRFLSVLVSFRFYFVHFLSVLKLVEIQSVTPLSELE